MKVCAVTGHRILGKEMTADAAEKAIVELIRGGADTFYVGMALGFDLLCAEVLCDMKEFYSLKLVACIPCEDQSDRYPLREKKRYERLLRSFDEKIVLHAAYCDGCMFERNRLMVDGCDVLLAYLRKKSGGTYYTVRYAEKKGKKIVYL